MGSYYILYVALSFKHETWWRCKIKVIGNKGHRWALVQLQSIRFLLGLKGICLWVGNVRWRLRSERISTLHSPHQSNQTLTRLQAVLMVWFWLLGLHSDSDQTLLGLYLDSRIDILNLCLKMKFACISMNWTLSLLHLAYISRFFGALTTWAKCLIYFCML